MSQEPPTRWLIGHMIRVTDWRAVWKGLKFLAPWWIKASWILRKPARPSQAMKLYAVIQTERLLERIGYLPGPPTDEDRLAFLGSLMQSFGVFETSIEATERISKNPTRGGDA
jgi:hypothetical protein